MTSTEKTKREFIRIGYRIDPRKNARTFYYEFEMKESRLINYVLKELSIDGKGEVEIIKCTQLEWEKKFT